jgi:hypothetical protein
LIAAGGWPHIYATAEAVDRIAFAGGIELTRAVGLALDEDALDRMLGHFPSLSSADELFKVLAYLNPEMGLRLFEKHVYRLAERFSPKPLESYSELFDTWAFLLGYAPHFLRRRKPPRDARRAARTFLRALDTRPLVAELSRPRFDWRWHNFWEFLSTYQEADPRGWAELIADVDLESLEASIVDQLRAPGTNLLFVLFLIAESRGDEIRALLDRHEAEMSRLDALMVHVHPQLAIRLLRRGLPLDLGLERHHYGSAAEELELIGQHGAEIAREVAEANAEAFLAGLASRHNPPFEDLSEWIAACDRWAPSLIDTALVNLDEGVVAGWADALRRPGSRREIAPLVVRAAATDTDRAPGREGGQLMRRFTSLQRQVDRD